MGHKLKKAMKKARSDQGTFSDQLRSAFGVSNDKRLDYANEHRAKRKKAKKKMGYKK